MMKKSIFAVAVASVLTLGAAQAETILYGSIRYDYENKKIENNAETVNGKTNFTGKRVSNLHDAGSRLGLKGTEDLGNNNAVIFNLEYGFDGMAANEKTDSKFTTRIAFMGLTGDWGTFTAGRQDNPFKLTVVDDTVIDAFNSTVSNAATQRAMTSVLTGASLTTNGEEFVTGENADGDTVYNVTSSDFDRVGKVIAYTTPLMAGFQANVALMMDDAETQEKNVDLWTLTANYTYDLGSNGAILTKASYINSKLGDKGAGKGKAWGLFLGYSQDAFAVSATYVDGNHKTTTNNVTDKNKSKGWDLGGSVSFGPNYFSSVRASYGENQLKNDGNKDKVKSWAVGFEQKLSTRTRAWVEYGEEKTKFSAVNLNKAKNSVVSIGMRHDF